LSLYRKRRDIVGPLIVESVLLFVMTKRRLGLHVFFWSRRAEA
jgi:hypothetical protein